MSPPRRIRSSHVRSSPGRSSQGRSPLLAWLLAPLPVLILGVAACTDESTGALAPDVGLQALDTGGTSGGTDTAPAPDTYTPPDTGPAVIPGGEPIPYEPCSGNADCESGWCVETADGRTCTRTCIEDCPSGWVCAGIANPQGGDVTFICTPRFADLCKPCTGESDCGGQGRCLDYGPQGSFCGAECTVSDGAESGACPSGYGCVEGQCRKTDAVCDCSWKAVKDAAKTGCSASNEFGTCFGVRSCLSGDLSSCDAPTAWAEACNGKDDDCDGLTDEALELGACQVTNGFGTCLGVEVCDDGDTRCTAREPALEVCNGQDDDCDGLADEGFADSDGDGLADCVSTDDDQDGVLDVVDNCPTVPNTPQTDQDLDGLGDACDGDLDGDGDPNDLDCEPTLPAVGHKATELCNAIDDNCSGVTDEGFSDLDGDAAADCVDPDDDGDGVPDLIDNCPVTANADQADQDSDGKGDACENDLDGDKDPDTTDCAPADPTVFHGATEICDGADQNCNGIIDEGSPDTDLDGVADCLDTDDDGDGVPDDVDTCPTLPNLDQLDTDNDGLGNACDTDDDGDGVPDSLDCGPLDAAVHPGAPEVCNGKDDNCSGLADELGAEGCVQRFYDGDGDGFGLSGVTQCTCSAQFPYTASEGGDCADTNGQVFPGATEVCNGKDDDCNGLPDEVGSAGCVERYEDQDGDGYGVVKACVCAGTQGWVPLGKDCDDALPSVNPGATETCDGVDQNCNGVTDEAGAAGCTVRFVDVDDDGYGKSGETRCLCAPEGLYTAAVGGDCNDNEKAMAPTLPEICDLLDNNCNGQVDEGVLTAFFKDNDSDGYGGTTSSYACSAPPGFAVEAGDCNDYNGSVHPGAAEVCNDLDDDCDGVLDEGLPLITIYRDNDGDGFASKTAVAQTKCNVPFGWATAVDASGDGVSDWDCDDSNVVAFPGGEELCDSADNNCDGVVDSQCPTVCAGAWPYAVTLPHHLPVRLIDLDGDSIDELIVIDASGKLARVSPNGTGTPLCPLLTVNAGADSRPTFVVNPALGSWRYYLQTGTRLYDLSACAEVKAAAGDLAGFGVTLDIDGDGVLDYAGHQQVGTQICTKRAATWTTSCFTSPNGKPWDGALVTAELDGDGKDELIAVRGRTFPGETYFDGSIDLLGWDGSALVLEDSMPPAITLITGSHLVAPVLADLNNVGGAPMDLLVGNQRYNLSTKTRVGAISLPDAAPTSQTADLDLDGDLDGAARGALVDLDNDGVPESISAVGNEIAIRSADASKTPLDGWPVLAGTFAWSVDAVVGDVNNDTRLDVFSPSVDGAIYCHQLAPGSATPANILDRGDTPWVNRTNAKDPMEPSDTAARAWPLRFPTKEVRAYLRKGDVDYYRVEGVGGLLIQLVSPPGKDYDFQWTNDTGTVTYASGTQGVGKVDSAAVCVGCNFTVPPSYLVRVYPKNVSKDYSVARPYVLRILKSP